VANSFFVDSGSCRILYHYETPLCSPGGSIISGGGLRALVVANYITVNIFVIFDFWGSRHSCYFLLYFHVTFWNRLFLNWLDGRPFATTSLKLSSRRRVACVIEREVIVVVACIMYVMAWCIVVNALRPVTTWTGDWRRHIANHPGQLRLSSLRGA